MAKPTPHQLVVNLAAALSPPAVLGNPVGSTGALANAAAPDVEELVTFTGLLGATVNQPGLAPPKVWRLLYLDIQLRTWMLIEESGIVDTAKIRVDSVPTTRDLDVVWVRTDASVARGGGAQSVEARWLAGEFTRAGDYQEPPSGGTMAASTGIFCADSTVTCCKRASN